MLPERENEREVQPGKGGLALPARGSLFPGGCCGMAWPAFGEPPESTALPTTKECEARKSVRVTSLSKSLFMKNL